MTNTLKEKLSQFNDDEIVIIKCDNAGYTVYKDKTLKHTVACIYTQKYKRGVLIFDDNYTMQEITLLFKKYKNMIIK